MSATVQIPARFNGPPGSGHGGYSAGLAASFIAGPAEVTLRVPPPLETDLRVEPGPDAVRLYDGETLVMEARAAEPNVEPADPVSPSLAREAALPTMPNHPFPTCFACGPDREPGEGLRLFCGPVPGRDGLFAAEWVPDPSVAGPGGEVEPLMMWAALDCPSAAPALVTLDPAKAIVLGRFCARIDALPRAGEHLAAVAWLLSEDGRKRFTASAIYDADGRLLAIGRATWLIIERS